MFKKPTEENPIVEIDFSDSLQKELKKLIDKITSKEYLDAMDKLWKICSKQNPYLN
jgi:mRNA-degrading endonuclease RelE of RelBE toxin-antitoxin system